MDTRAFIVAALCLAPSGAQAADWSLKGLFGESALYDSNLGLTSAGPSEAFGLLSDLSLDLAARTPTTDFTLDTDLNYPVYAGPGAPVSRLQFSTIAGFEKRTKLSTIRVLASMARQSTTTTELLDSGVVNINAFRLSRSLEAKFSHEFNPLNSVSLSAIASQTSFTDASATLIGNRDFATAATWTHRVSRLTDVKGTVGYERFDPDDPTKPGTNLYGAAAGITSKLTQRLSFQGSLGVNLTQPDTGVTKASPTWRVGLDYTLKNTSIGVTGEQQAFPSSLGELQSVIALGLNVSHVINQASRVAVSANYSDFSSSAGARNLLIVSPSYSYQLNQNCKAELIYSFTRAAGDTGTATSNRVVVKLLRNLDIFY